MTADDYGSGTRAVAVGGVTTIIYDALQQPGRSLGDAMVWETNLACPQAHTDYSFHIVVVDLDATSGLRELRDLVADGLLRQPLRFTVQ